MCTRTSETLGITPLPVLGFPECTLKLTHDSETL